MIECVGRVGGRDAGLRGRLAVPGAVVGVRVGVRRGGAQRRGGELRAVVVAEGVRVAPDRAEEVIMEVHQKTCACLSTGTTPPFDLKKRHSAGGGLC